MSLTILLILIAAALLARLLGRGRLRVPLLLVVSVLAVFWLQPATPIRRLDFWLPVATLTLAVLGWLLTVQPDQRWRRGNALAGGLVVGVVLLVALTRYLNLDGILTPSRPPQLHTVLIVLAALSLAGLALARWSQPQRGWLWVAFAALVGLLVVLKLPPLATTVSAGLRALASQDTSLASAGDLRWLGFSYLAFRLIHTIRDRQAGRLPDATLAEYLVYMMFFPALMAGPIDRLERFLKDLRAPQAPLEEDLLAAAPRLAVGLLRKFVLADTLGLVALGAANAPHLQSTAWAWVALYAYAFQIFFDFAGYSDIAIGAGRLLGIQLPENFNAPYRRSNLALFWNNWHMTLTQWFRAYFFNPLTRSLRRARHPLSTGATILLTQVSTMVLIGLWHGITWNFVLWGVWHGLGMFVQNRYSEWARPRMGWLESHPRLQQAVGVLNVLATFHFVALGWVWFALPTPALSLSVFKVLLGRL
ncbi:MAG: MBOAT family protein [Anaerolineae bacterium]|nr:MBOAT family protein [Anaerolineae bacterium]